MQPHPPSILFIGRFQPFHKGHERILAHLLRRYEKVVIAIGSSQEKRTKKNPFSARERKRMIQGAARARLGWNKKISFAFLRDYKKNRDWTAKVRGRFPPSRFAIASANPLVRSLLRGAGYALHPSPLFRRAEWEGRRIRRMMRKRGKAKEMVRHVPAVLQKWMEKKGMKIIASSRF